MTVFTVTLPPDKHGAKLKEEVIAPEQGVKAVNYRNPDGSWTVIIERSAQAAEDAGASVIAHELGEIALREEGQEWEEAHREVEKVLDKNRPFLLSLPEDLINNVGS